MTTVDPLTLTGLFSTARFREVAKTGGSSTLEQALARAKKTLGLHRPVAHGDVIAQAYSVLERHYKNEYVYKNTLIGRIYVGRHRAARSVLLQEFNVGNSVADSLLINGQGVVYEIKTEYDDLSKLQHQIRDYLKAFKVCNVVAHPSMLDALTPIAHDTGAGVLLLTKRGSLSPAISPVERADLLDVRTMVNALRVSEVEQILTHKIGPLSEVSNVKRHRTYVQLAESIGTEGFQAAMLSQLKLRRSQISKDLMMDRTLIPLRSVLLKIDPDPSGASAIVSWTRQRST